MSTKEREIVAYHESGHAIVATVLPGPRSGAQDLDRAARVRRARLHDAAAARRSLSDDAQRSAEPARGAARRTDGRGDRARRDLDRRAERPAARDRHRARDGHRVRHERRARRHQLRRQQACRASSIIPLPQERGLYGEETAQKIDAEIKRILNDAHATARQILSDNRDKLEDVTRRLLEVEVMEGDELRQILEPASGIA